MTLEPFEREKWGMRKKRRDEREREREREGVVIQMFNNL